MLRAGMGLGRGVRQNDIVAFGRSALSERSLQSCGFSARALSAPTANVMSDGHFSRRFCWTSSDLPGAVPEWCRFARMRE